ncbi:MAG TPA: hypothetical protein VKE41_02710, partial [Roseiflexaceae bacterium]|nr:hypothetical protein [Roseiflexaceae bacterium]
RKMVHASAPFVKDVGTEIIDTAGLLRWEVWRAKRSKMLLVLRLVRAALPPEPGAKKKRLGGLWPPHPENRMAYFGWPWDLRIGKEMCGRQCGVAPALFRRGEGFFASWLI